MFCVWTDPDLEAGKLEPRAPGSPGHKADPSYGIALRPPHARCREDRCRRGAHAVGRRASSSSTSRHRPASGPCVIRPRRSQVPTSRNPAPRCSATLAAFSHVEFRRGVIEDLPLDDVSVDVVISNCVINLSPDKPAVLAEAFRVLAPGGRLRVADVVAEVPLSDERRAELGDVASCAGGAMSDDEYVDLLARAGFVDAEVTVTARRDNGVHPAVVRARKPGASA